MAVCCRNTEGSGSGSFIKKRSENVTSAEARAGKAAA
jgi:hypothetical protein